MTIGLIWIAALALYLLFRVWYGNMRGPMSAAEVAKYEAWVDGREGLEPELREAMRAFLKSDDGKEFVMLNLIKLHEGPVADPATGELKPASQILTGYTTKFLRELLRRGGHPMVMAPRVGGYIEAWNTPPDPGWSMMGYVRYRSRRDLFEMASSPMFRDSHVYKVAAMAQTYAFPTQIRLRGFIGPRGAVALILALIAALATIAVMAAT